MAKKVRILKQTPLADGDKFDINGCIGFSIKNDGVFDASYGYEGMGDTFDLPVGQTVLYGFLPDGFEFDGNMEVNFKNSQVGKLVVILFKALNKEG
jgi:hypothetical protein